MRRRLKYCCNSSQPNPTAPRPEPTVAGVHVRCPLSESFQLSVHYSEIVKALSDGVAFWTHDLLAESVGGLRVSVYFTIANTKPLSDLVSRQLAPCLLSIACLLSIVIQTVEIVLVRAQQEARCPYYLGIPMEVEKKAILHSSF
jgi:hypothetical protein